MFCPNFSLSSIVNSTSFQPCQRDDPLGGFHTLIQFLPHMLSLLSLLSALPMEHLDMMCYFPRHYA